MPEQNPAKTNPKKSPQQPGERELEELDRDRMADEGGLDEPNPDEDDQDPARDKDGEEDEQERITQRNPAIGGYEDKPSKH